MKNFVLYIYTIEDVSGEITLDFDTLNFKCPQDVELLQVDVCLLRALLGPSTTAPGNL